MNETYKVFCGNMCFVCHVSVKEKKLMKCGSCKSISYCSKAHQKIHWKHHNQLCKVIKQVDSLLNPNKIENFQNWYDLRTKFLMLCELKMERKLKSYEMNMILFPNNCQICHKKSNLKACLECLSVNYCSEDHKQIDMNFHNDVCHLLALCLGLDLYLEKHPNYPAYCFRENSFVLCDTISDFIESFITVENNNSLTTAIQEKALVSELITCPLSLLWASQSIDYNMKGIIIIHIVGCSYLETASLKSWEIILHLNPKIDALDMHFVGPEVKENHIQPCETCQKKLSLNFFNGFYHEYLRVKSQRKPNIICTFNSGYHEFENSNLDTWRETLPLLIKNLDIPLIFTSFTEDEAEKDVRRLLAIKKKLKVKITKNKFSSLRPHRDLENLGIYFNNAYIGTVLQEPG